MATTRSPATSSRPAITGGDGWLRYRLRRHALAAAAAEAAAARVDGIEAALITGGLEDALADRLDLSAAAQTECWPSSQASLTSPMTTTGRRLPGWLVRSL